MSRGPVLPYHHCAHALPPPVLSVTNCISKDVADEWDWIRGAVMNYICKDLSLQRYRSQRVCVLRPPKPAVAQLRPFFFHLIWHTSHLDHVITIPLLPHWRFPLLFIYNFSPDVFLGASYAREPLRKDHILQPPPVIPWLRRRTVRTQYRTQSRTEALLISVLYSTSVLWYGFQNDHICQHLGKHY